MCMLTCSQKGKTRTALDGFPNVNPNLLCCLAYVHVRKTELSERSQPCTQVHFLFQCKPGNNAGLQVYYTYCLASSAPLCLLFHLHPQRHSKSYSSTYVHLGRTGNEAGEDWEWGWGGLGMRLGRSGNEVGEDWEWGWGGLGMRQGRTENEVGETWERDCVKKVHSHQQCAVPSPLRD